MDVAEGVILAVAIEGFWTFMGHYLGSRELRKGFSETRAGFEKMDERFEATLKAIDNCRKEVSSKRSTTRQ